MWIPYAFWPTLAAVVMILIPLIYVLKAGIKKPGNLGAFILFLSVFIWSFGEMLERIAGPPSADYQLAYIGATTIAVGVFLTSAGLIHISIDFPRKIKIKKKTRKLILIIVYLFSLAGIFLDLIDSKVIIPEVHSYSALGQQIWGMDTGLIYSIYSAWLAIAGLIILVIFSLKLRGEKINLVRSQIKIIIYGIILVYVLVVPTGLVPIILGIDFYPLTTISFSIFGIFVFYAIYRYRMFLVAPVIESKVEEEKMPKMGVYVMERDEGYIKFAKLAKSGNEALAFISNSPEDFKEKYDLKIIPVFEITDQMGKDRLNPSIEEHQEMIPFIISSFVDESKSPVILMDIHPSLNRIVGRDKAEKIMRNIWREVDKTKAVYIVIK